MSKIDLSIIIVSYNTAEITLQTVKSAVTDIKTSDQLRSATEIIVVDNNSSDNSVSLVRAFLADNFQNHLIIRNKENLGFAKANNLAIKKAQGEYLLLLNSDTIIKKGALNRLVEVFKNHPINETSAHLTSAGDKVDRLGILAAKLLNKDGTIQPQGGSFPDLASLTCHMLMLDDLPLIGKFLPSTQYTGKNTHQHNRAGLIIQDWVGGTAMMINKLLIDEIGELDGNIFMYAEDVEFCLRAKNHHWDIAICPQAEIIHLGSASSSSANAILGELKGYVYIWKKHKPDWQLPFLRLILKLGAMLRILLFGTILKDKHRRHIYRQALREI